MSLKLQTALQRYSDLKTITVIVPLQKFKKKLRKGAITNDHSNGSTSPSRLSTNVTITEKLKNLKFSQKLRYSSDTELINNFDKKSQFRFDCKNTTFCEHHKYKQWIPNLLMLWFYEKTSFRSCFKLETHPTVMALWSHHASIWSSFHLRNKTRTKIAYER